MTDGTFRGTSPPPDRLFSHQRKPGIPPKAIVIVHGGRGDVWFLFPNDDKNIAVSAQ